MIAIDYLFDEVDLVGLPKLFLGSFTDISALKLYNSFLVIVVVKLAIRLGCWVHREQFNVWFLGDT